MDRETATKLIARLISATQSGALSWRKQPASKIKAADHAISAVYFGEFGDLGFRIYHYRWERADYYSWDDVMAAEVEPRIQRGVILELLDDDGDLVDKIDNAHALRDLFEVTNQSVGNFQDKIKRILTSKPS